MSITEDRWKAVEEDLWKGSERGPSITSRLLVLEGDMRDIKKLFWAILGGVATILVGIVTDLIVHVLKI